MIINVEYNNIIYEFRLISDQDLCSIFSYRGHYSYIDGAEFHISKDKKVDWENPVFISKKAVLDNPDFQKAILYFDKYLKLKMFW